MPTFGSLFAGIGGIDLGLERAGWTGRWQVEWDPFCQHVLAHHWPDVPRYGDIHGVHGAAACPDGDANSGDVSTLRAVSQGDGSQPRRDSGGTCGLCLEPVDLIAGGFPCQPWSVAGKRQGTEDDRWLWPEFERTVRELRPRYVLVENVPGLLAGRGGMGAVLGGLAALGYDAEWDVISAAAVGAPHLRDRVWIVAHADRSGRQEPRWSVAVGTAFGPAERGGASVEDADCGTVESRRRGRGTPEAGQLADTTSGTRLWQAQGQDGHPPFRHQGNGADCWRVEPDVGRVAHGVPARVDRLRALGNAVVPQVVEVIGRRMMAAYLEGAA